MCHELKNNLDLAKDFCSYYSVNVFFIAKDKLPKYGRATNTPFFSTVNVTRVCKNFLFERVLMQLSASLMVFLKCPLND